MKKRILFSLGCLLTSAWAQPATADDTQVCEVYGKIGSVGTAFLMDRTFRDVISMMQGTNSQMEADMGMAIATSLTSSQISLLGSLSAEDGELIGAAAGSKGFELMMTGRATTSEEVRVILKDECARIGIEQIKSIQRSANAAMTVQ